MEVFRLLIDNLEAKDLKVPKEVSLLDYAGFKLRVLAATQRPDWQAIRRTVGEAAGWWNAINAQVSAKSLRDAFGSEPNLRIHALLGLSVALVHVVRKERYLGRVTEEIRRLEPEAKAVDALAEELGRKRRVLGALGSAEEGRVPALPVLRELTETLPASAWLQALTMDRQGVELTGQADGASALIPLLEASSRLERVEFTSPVTKAQGKEQFRIRAAWEKASPGPAPHAALSPTGRGAR